MARPIVQDRERVPIAAKKQAVITGREMKRVWSVVLFMLLVIAGGTVFAEETGPDAIPFSSNLEATLELAKQSGKPVVLAFGAVWCPNCQKMERVTLQAPEVLALADRFHWVLIDIDRNLTVAREYDVIGTPTIFFLDSEGEIRRRILGAVPPAEYSALLTKFLAELEGQPEEAVEPEEGFSYTELTLTPKGYRGLAICFSHVGYGPPNLTSQSPFQSLRLALVPRTPSTLARGQFDVRATATWANIWANDDEFFDPMAGEFGNRFLDFEMLHTSVSLAYGVTDTLELELQLEDRRRFGGAMDSFIQSFHDFFGIDQDGRDQVPKDQFVIFLDPGGGQPTVSLDSGDRGSFSRNVLFTVQHNVTCGTAKWPAFSYAFTGRWTKWSDDLVGGGLDFSGSVAAARRLGKFYVYLTLGLAHYGSNSFRGIELRNSQFSGLAVGEWRFRPRTSFLLQWLVSEGAAPGYDPFSKPSHEVTLGWKREIIQQGVLEVGLVENVVTFDNSPDLGFHLGYTQRF